MEMDDDPMIDAPAGDAETRPAEEGPKQQTAPPPKAEKVKENEVA